MENADSGGVSFRRAFNVTFWLAWIVACPVSLFLLVLEFGEDGTLLALDWSGLFIFPILAWPLAMISLRSVLTFVIHRSVKNGALKPLRWLGMLVLVASLGAAIGDLFSKRMEPWEVAPRRNVAEPDFLRTYRELRSPVASEVDIIKKRADFDSSLQVTARGRWESRSMVGYVYPVSMFFITLGALLVLACSVMAWYASWDVGDRRLLHYELRSLLAVMLYGVWVLMRKATIDAKGSLYGFGQSSLDPLGLVMFGVALFSLPMSFAAGLAPRLKAVAGAVTVAGGVGILAASNERLIASFRDGQFVVMFHLLAMVVLVALWVGKRAAGSPASTR